MRCALVGERLRTRCGEQRDEDSGEEDEYSKRNAEIQEPAFAEATAGATRGAGLSSVFRFHR